MGVQNKFRFVAGAFLFLAFIFSTGLSCQRGVKSSLPVASLSIQGHSIDVEVASQPATRTTGLMFRKELGKDNGMLFVFPDSAPRGFWMKNTLIPLSIAFMDEKGKILNILEMPPLVEETFPSAGSAQYALEMNTGWFERNSIKAGDVVAGLDQTPKGE